MEYQGTMLKVGVPPLNLHLQLNEWAEVYSDNVLKYDLEMSFDRSPNIPLPGLLYVGHSVMARVEVFFFLLFL